MAGLTTLLTLALAEVTVRALGIDRGPNDRLRYHSLFGWTANPDRTDRDGILPSGFRHPPVERDKPQGTRRLVILGDSFSFGGVFPYGSTFAGLLEEWLTASDERWEVINLGVSGWGTAQQLLAFEELALPLDPDVVLLQVFPYNDLCNNTRALAMTCDTEDYYRPYLEPVAGEAGGWRRSWIHPLRGRLRAASALFRAVERRGAFGLGPPKPPADLPSAELQRWLMDLHRTHANAAGLTGGSSLQSMVPDDLQPAVVRQSWDVSERILARLAGELEEHRIPWIAMVVPNPRSFDPVWVERIRNGKRWPRGVPIEPGYDTARMERYLADLGGRSIRLRRRLESDVMAPVDHFHPFGKVRDLHFNRLGHYRVAQWVIEEMVSAGWTATATPPPVLADAELVAHDVVMPVAVRGLQRLRRRADDPVRVALAEEVSLAFWSPDASDMVLRFSLWSPAAGEPVTVEVNGDASSRRVGPNGGLGHRVRFVSQPGRNEVRLLLPAFAEPSDAARFSSLVIRRSRK